MYRKEQSLSFLPPWEFQTLLSLGNPRLLLNLSSKYFSQTAAFQTPCPKPTPRDFSNSCPLSWWCHPNIHPLLSPYPLAFNVSQQQNLPKLVSSSHQVTKYWSCSFSTSHSNHYINYIDFHIIFVLMIYGYITHTHIHTHTQDHIMKE